jgi:hypothetical protein
MNKMYIGLLIFVIFVGLSGCTTETSSTATSTGQDLSSDHVEEQKEILSTVTHATVMTSTKNWDSDADDDGMVVYPALKDESDETVKFEAIELNVDIEIWTTDLDDDFDTVKDKLVYEGSSIIDNWEDGNFMFGGGIKIPFEDIKTTESDSDFGMILVKIHTFDDNYYEAKEEFAVRIKPE